jgi:hypothetical protein
VGCSPRRHFDPEPFATRAEIVETVDDLFPEVDTSDPSWLLLDLEGVAIEFNLSDPGSQQSVMLHVRGGDRDTTMAALARVADALEVDVLDISLGETMDFDDNPGEGFDEWKAYRDQVVGE